MSGRPTPTAAPQNASPVRPAPPRHVDRELLRILSSLRWGIILTALAITLLWPTRTTLGPPLWMMVALFALYNGVLELVHVRVTQLRLSGYLPLLDLLVLAPLYYVDSEPAGLIFTLFVLVLLAAAFTMPLRRTVLYTFLTLLVVAVLAPTLPSWVTTHTALRLFASRLLMLTIVGVGSGLLVRELTQSRAATVHMAELDRLREGFVASISHDLHTPLTAITSGLGMLDASLAGQLRPSQQGLLQIARQNGERLRLLIDDLLAYNQIQVGALSLERAPIDLRSVATEAVSAVKLALGTKHQSLELDLPEPLPLLGDQRRLEQVIINLLSNASKYTPPDSRIVLSGCATPAGIHLAVSDNGPGIPPETHDAIFRPFYRFDSTVDGAGLGLAIVRKIVELHGGQIQVESGLNSGTTFHITLPQHSDALGVVTRSPASQSRG